MKLGQNFVKYFVRFLGNGDLRSLAEDTKVIFFGLCSDNGNQKFNIPISIDISIKTHQFVCIRSA